MGVAFATVMHNSSLKNIVRGSLGRITAVALLLSLSASQAAAGPSGSPSESLRAAILLNKATADWAALAVEESKRLLHAERVLHQASASSALDVAERAEAVRRLAAFGEACRGHREFLASLPAAETLTAGWAAGDRAGAAGHEPAAVERVRRARAETLTPQIELLKERLARTERLGSDASRLTEYEALRAAVGRLEARQVMLRRQAVDGDLDRSDAEEAVAERIAADWRRRAARAVPSRGLGLNVFAASRPVPNDRRLEERDAAVAALAAEDPFFAVEADWRAAERRVATAEREWRQLAVAAPETAASGEWTVSAGEANAAQASATAARRSYLEERLELARRTAAAAAQLHAEGHASWLESATATAAVETVERHLEYHAAIETLAGDRQNLTADAGDTSTR